ncbi:hypothetical protein EG347_21355 [Chryseobacterium sp. G0186]|nr:hypothetical protein EG347_21355 [Chryseobacterium sp. G0186]
MQEQKLIFQFYAMKYRNLSLIKLNAFCLSLILQITQMTIENVYNIHHLQENIKQEIPQN